MMMKLSYSTVFGHIDVKQHATRSLIMIQSHNSIRWNITQLRVIISHDQKLGMPTAGISLFHTVKEILG